MAQLNIDYCPQLLHLEWDRYCNTHIISECERALLPLVREFGSSVKYFINIAENTSHIFNLSERSKAFKFKFAVQMMYPHLAIVK